MSIASIVAFLTLVNFFVIIGAVCHALLKTSQPQAALAWVVAIITLPFIGAGAYIIFGVSRVDGLSIRLFNKVAQKRGRHIRYSESLRDISRLKVDTSILPAPLLKVGENNLSTMPLLGGNEFTALYSGDQAYPQMLGAIRNAKHEVFLCTYIFMGKQYAQYFVDALIAAHERGVDVRILIDGVGTLTGSKPWKKLLEKKVPLAKFMPPKLFPPKFSINLRNHRKVLVCDEVSFTGGMNIADYHVLSSNEKNLVQDLHFKCLGPISSELREAFLMDWAFVTDEFYSGELIIPENKGNMPARVIMDGPGSISSLGTFTDPLVQLICGVLSCAKRRVIVFSPYFLPPKEIINALSSASSRGVQVQIVLPATIDHQYIEWASNHLIPSLLIGGVEIYRQPGYFAHTKLILIDDDYVCIGSTNLDPRSLNLNFELNVEIFSQELNAELTEYAENIIHKSKAVTVEELSSLSLLVKLRNAAVWIFSPYL